MATEKSKDAFRTISEVAEVLDVPAHVLRFWESRFTQVKPVKRAGGRRYYRRTDIALLDGIRKLLHDDGLTIRGVQKMLREEGVRAVAALGRPRDLQAGDPALDSDLAAEAPDALAGSDDAPMAEDVQPEAETSRVLSFRRHAAERAEPAAEGDTEGTAAALAPDASKQPSPPEAAGDLAAGPDSANAESDASAESVAGSGAGLPAEDARGATTGAAGIAGAAIPGGEPPATDRGDAPQPSPAGIALAQPDLPADPDDDDPAFAVAALDLSRLRADPSVLRPLYDRLLDVRRRLGDPGRRGPAA